MSDTDYPEKFFQTNEFIYHLAGIFLYNPPKISSARRISQIIWTILVYVISLYFLYLELIIFRETIHDIKKFFSQFSLLLTHILGIVRVVLLLSQHQRLLKLQNSLQDELYHYEACGDFVPGKLLRDAKLLSSKFSIMLYTLYSLVGVLTFISTEINIEWDIKEEQLKDNVTCYDYMPYYFVIPFDPTTKTNCKWANVLMSYNLSSYAWFISCHDGLLAALLNCLKTQLIILCGAIRTIRPRVLKRLSLPVNLILHKDDEIPKLEKALYNEIIHLNRHLAVLLEAAEELELIFTYMTLGQTLASLITFASCLFVATNVPVTSPTFFSQSEYFGCVFIQFSVFCWFGSGVTIASEDINLSLYNSDWYSASRRFKSALITTMCRMQRPIYLTIGKFSPLTLNAMVAVCKGSVSYYAVFKSVDN